MKHFTKRAFVIAVASICISMSIQAQKYGHLNSGNLLEILPEVQIADSLLIVYRDSLVAIGKEKGAALQKEVTEFLKKRDAGELTPLQEQKQTTKLQAAEKELAAYEQTVIKAVQQRRQDYLSPILQRVNDAVQDIGAEHHYMMIFDTSLPNTVLFVEEADNIMPLVLKKLGIEKK